jgi:hypothetical protein
MARKKEPPKPLFALRHDFVASLENVCNECIMMLQAVEMVTRESVPNVSIPGPVRELLKERVQALRAALMSEDGE